MSYKHFFRLFIFQEKLEYYVFVYPFILVNIHDYTRFVFNSALTRFNTFYAFLQSSCSLDSVRPAHTLVTHSSHARE